jgi:hypothetical protein
MNFPKPQTWRYMPLYEKIGVYAQHLDERFAPYIDKLEVKSIVPRLCSDVKTAPVIRVLESPSDIHAHDLGFPHLLKAAHGCGWNLPLDGSISLSEIQTALKTWHANPYSTKEKQYTHVKPRYFIESIINDKYTGLSGKARVFMVRCIHGKPVSVGVREGQQQNSYFPDFRRMAPDSFPLEKPALWDDLIHSAALLSAPFEFVRVDFYIGADHCLYFSEFTFTPAGGHRVFTPAVERELGKLWR